MSGVLIGVGLGPGDPELVTLKAWRLLSGAEVVAYPAALDEKGEPRPSIARRIAEDFLPEDVREIEIMLPMRPDDLSPAAEAYDVAAAAIAAELEVGRDVAALCEGDPMFYGSFINLLPRLGDRFEIEVIPGVTSFAAAAAAGGAPLCRRNESFTVIPAPLTDAEIEARLVGAGAGAILKIGRHMPRVRALLERLGLAERCLYAERVGQDNEGFAALADAPDEAPYFSLILISSENAP